MSLDTKEFMTGIEAIDKGHRQLVGLLNKILDFQMNNQEYNYSTIMQCLDDIVEYSVEHLDNEDEIMRSVGYPDYKKHFEKHNFFRDEINKILESFEYVTNDNINASLCQISNILIHWFRAELLADDIKLAAYIKENSFK